ncbi:hypothetical protein QTQ03_27525 [Micromonospora sp. WMMA1363]|uniref:hypothetical protein n=1 Tax=Micromonospora sp. WMMA1363 TaxID=3053985 RepID=UPI00259CC067|nr:hypothetical protein [Micromonospora sp. WMMA1363]MDM4723169.1 hypothetical protein [Micromonospora sp. WMMA1363]
MRISRRRDRSELLLVVIVNSSGGAESHALRTLVITMACGLVLVALRRRRLVLITCASGVGARVQVRSAAADNCHRTR